MEIENDPPKQTTDGETGTPTILPYAPESAPNVQCVDGADGLTWLSTLKKVGIDRQIELFLSFAIVVLVAGQVMVALSSSKSSTKQLEQIIAAAGRIDHAAESFSGSSSLINEGVNNAVAKLSLQASAIEAARKSSEDSSRKGLQVLIDNAHSDQRAYVVALLDNDGGLYLDRGKRYSRFSAPVHYVNVGRTPAISVEVVAELRLQPVGQEMSIPTYSGLTGSTLSVGVTGSQSIASVASDSQQDQLNIDIARAQGGGSYMVRGYIFYKDIFEDRHVTAFCNIYPFTRTAFSSPIQCSNWNWIDKRPGV